MTDPLAKEFNQIVKPSQLSQQSALLEHLAAIKKVVVESENALYGFGGEALQRVENLARYAAQLPENIRETLTLNIVNASTLKQQIDEIGKLDRLVEYYRQRELRRERMAETKRFNVFAGAGMGAGIAVFFSFVLIAFIPGKFQTGGQMGSTFVGLSVLLGGGGAAIGSAKK